MSRPRLLPHEVDTLLNVDPESLTDGQFEQAAAITDADLTNRSDAEALALLVECLGQPPIDVPEAMARVRGVSERAKLVAAAIRELGGVVTGHALAERLGLAESAADLEIGAQVDELERVRWLRRRGLSLALSPRWTR